MSSATPAVVAMTAFAELELGARDGVPLADLVELLARTGLKETTARSAIQRLRDRGTLEPAGPVRLTAHARPEAHAIHRRAMSDSPFAADPGGWTLVSLSVALGARGGARRRLGTALEYRAFADLGDGLWLTPRDVDVERLLARLGLAADELDLHAFTATDPGLPTETIAALWRLDERRVRHEETRSRLEDATRPPLARLLDAVELVRSDPWLPTGVLPADDPAEASARAMRRDRDAWRSAAA